MEESYQIKDDWHFKMLVFFLKLHGLHAIYFEDGILSRTALYFRRSIVGLQCFFMLHSLTSILVHVNEEAPVQLRVLSHYSLYVGVSIYSACRNYALLSRRTDITYLLKDSCRMSLHSAHICVGPFWRRHAHTLTFLWIGYILTADMVGLGLLGIVSPFLRFVIRREKPTHILRPVWYPPWVYSSPTLCWCAAVYEWVLIFDTSLALIVPDLLYLYLTHATIVKLEALGQFFADSFEDNVTNTCLDSFKSLCDKDDLKACPDRKLEAFKKGILDWHILWRESKLINSVYATGATWAVLVGVTNNTFMSYIAVTHINLRHSLWRCDWFVESLAFKKIFLCFNCPLLRCMQMKVLRLQPFNLKSFSRNLSRAFSHVRFLLHLSHPN